MIRFYPRSIRDLVLDLAEAALTAVTTDVTRERAHPHLISGGQDSEQAAPLYLI